jgi:hypothetical protein
VKLTDGSYFFCGTGTAGFSGDGGSATGAKFEHPTDVLLDGSGNLYIADSGNKRIRKVTPGGIITTIAGGGLNISTDGVAATNA